MEAEAREGGGDAAPEEKEAEEALPEVELPPERPKEEIVVEAKDAAKEAVEAAREAAETALQAAELAARSGIDGLEAAVASANEAAQAAESALEDARLAAEKVKELAEEAQWEADRPRDSDADKEREELDPEAYKAEMEKLEEFKVFCQAASDETQAALRAVASQQQAAQAAAQEAANGQAVAAEKAANWVRAHGYSQEEHPKSAIIFLHGQGEIEAVWAEILPPSVSAPLRAGPCRWIWPRASFAPCTSRGGAMTLQWFDTPEFPVCSVIRGVPDRKRREEDPKQVAEAVRAVHAAIVALEAEGVESQRIVVGGFGQGAALAAHAVLRYEKTLAGGVLLSPWVPCLEALSKTVTTAGSAAELLWVHGSRDAVVLPRVAVEHMRALQDLGANVEFHLLPELGFDVNDEVLAYFHAWLGKRLLASMVSEEEEVEQGEPGEGDEGDGGGEDQPKQPKESQEAAHQEGGAVAEPDTKAPAVASDVPAPPPAA